MYFYCANTYATCFHFFTLFSFLVILSTNGLHVETFLIFRCVCQFLSQKTIFNYLFSMSVVHYFTAVNIYNRKYLLNVLTERIDFETNTEKKDTPEKICFVNI